MPQMRPCVISLFAIFLYHFPLRNSMFVIQHSQVPSLYLELRQGFQGEDPFNSYSLTNRANLCNDIIKANSYFYILDNAPFSKVSRQSIDPQNASSFNIQFLGSDYTSYWGNESLKYNERDVIVNSFTLKMRMFACFQSRDTELYVTYGFQNEYAFLLTHLKFTSDSSLRVKAMILPTPNFNYEIDNNYFWKCLIPDSGSSKIHQAPRVMELCFLSKKEYKYFTVCSAIADVLSTREKQLGLQLNIKKSNYIKKIKSKNLCVEAMIVDVQTNRRAIANVLPCAINRDWSEPQFYLLSDPFMHSLIFVLKPHDRNVVFSVSVKDVIRF